MNNDSFTSNEQTQRDEIENKLNASLDEIKIKMNGT